MNTPIAMNDAVSGSQNPASTGAPASVLPLRARSEVPAETEAAARRRIAGHFARSVVPSPLRAPQSVEDCGLPQTFLVELVAKTIYQRGTGRLVELVNLLCLPGSVIEALCQFMRQDGIIEIGRRGANDADVHFDLTSAGRTRATEWLARNQYVGPAPVALDVYTERVRAQSVHKQRITRTQVGEAFRDLIMPEGIGDALGTALNSGKPLLIYGDAGAGKTYVASHVRRLLGGTIAIPHAVYVHGEVVRVFDAHWHTPALFPADLPASGIDNRARADARWVACERPCVSAGGELTLAMLDLSFDSRAGFYEAPPHVKANNGLFIVDDMGRQMVSPTALMNRWIVPMEHRFDHLMLANGGKFAVPFDLVLVFSSNLRPAELADTAFLRRLGHKIEVGALAFDDYMTLFERACHDAGVGIDGATASEVLRECHARDARPMLASYPRDLVALVASRAAYLEVDATMSAELIGWAWHCYFGDDESTNEAGPLVVTGATPDTNTHRSTR